MIRGREDAFQAWPAAPSVNAAMVEALTPSAETQAAYMNTFRFPFPAWDKDGVRVMHSPNVPWVTIKEIMAAIKARADARIAATFVSSAVEAAVQS